MERLTYVDARGRVLFTPSEEVDENPDIGYDIRQIAEYGYREYLSLIAERLANREQYCEMLEGELKTYKDAEEQGLLLRLPCKLDIDVFVIPTKENSFNQIACMKFLGIQWDTLGAVMNLFSNNRFDKNVPKMYQPSISKFGKTVFLTEQKAEAALEKMKGGAE